MRSNSLFRKSVIAAGLIAAFAALPMAQAAAAEARVHTMTSDNQTIPDKAADSWITTKVKSKFATTKHMNARDISVSTTEGVVMLTGKVATSREKSRAEHIARRIKGVKGVNASGLKVDPAVN